MFEKYRSVIRGFASCFLLFSIGAPVFAYSHKERYNFKLVHEWKQIEYKFGSEVERTEAINNGSFRVGKIQPMDAQYTYNEFTGRTRIFVSTPRVYLTGVPATIGVVTNETRDGNPIIDPYPSWSWHLNPEKCADHRLVSLYRVWVDECNRLWIADTGTLGSTFVCPPQILAFDLKTDRLLYKYEIPYEQYQNVSLFVSVMAEVENRRQSCENTWLYITDTDGYSLLVFSLKQCTSWSVKDRSFLPNPKYSVYTIAGTTFNASDGIITAALSPASDGLDRKLYYHAMSSVQESWVYVKDLKNPSNFIKPLGSPWLFHTYRYKRDQQSVMEATDRKGNLYFSLLIDVEIVKWNPMKPYKKENFEIIGNDKETMQYPSGLKVLPYKNGRREALWAFAVAYQKFAAGTLNGNEINFRLLVTAI